MRKAIFRSHVFVWFVVVLAGLAACESKTQTTVAITILPPPPTATPAPTEVPTESPVPTPTAAPPTETPTPIPTNSQTGTMTPKPTLSPTPAPTPTPGATRVSFAPQVTFATGTKPLSVATADVNGDGKPDLIVADIAEDTVSVLLNTTTPFPTPSTWTPTVSPSR